jgi:hypothetical protein
MNEEKVLAEIDGRFTFHKPDKNGVTCMRSIRRTVRVLAQMIQILCPEGKEKEAAFLQLQMVMMLANSAIVQKYPIDPDDV